MKNTILSPITFLLVGVLFIGGCGRSTYDPSLTEAAASEAVSESYAETAASEAASESYRDDAIIDEETSSMSATEQIVEEDDNSYEGILAIHYTAASNYQMYTSTGTFKCLPFTVDLDVINPDTGEVKNMRTFSSMQTNSCSADGRFVALGDFFRYRQTFNEDYSKMAAVLSLEDGQEHVGYIDETGNFTDITALITDSGGFDGLIRHARPLFGADNMFYFYDATYSNEWELKRVSLDDIQPSAVESADNIIYGADGTVEEVYSMRANYIYYSADSAFGAPGGLFGDWVSETEIVGGARLDEDMISKYVLSGDENSLEWYTEEIELVPSIKDRQNGNPIASPDGTRVAFLSNMKVGTDTSKHLFVVPIDGGNPEEIHTSYSFLSQFNGDIRGTDIVRLIDWITPSEESINAVDEEPIINEDNSFIENGTATESVFQISQEDMDKTIERGREVFISYAENSWIEGYEILNVDYLDHYYLSNDNSDSAIIMTYKVSIIDIDGAFVEFYYMVKFNDVTTDSDGNVYIAGDEYVLPTNIYEYYSDVFQETFWVHGYESSDDIYDIEVVPLLSRGYSEKSLTIL